MIEFKETKANINDIQRITGKTFEELKENNFKDIEGELRMANAWSYRNSHTKEELAEILVNQENQEEKVKTIDEKIEKEVLENIELLANEIEDKDILQGLRELWKLAKGYGAGACEVKITTEKGKIDYENSVIKGLKKRGIEPKSYL